LQKKLKTSIYGAFITIVIISTISTRFRTGIDHFFGALNSNFNYIPTIITTKYNQWKENFTAREVLLNEIKRLKTALDTEKIKFTNTHQLREENRALRLTQNLEPYSNYKLLTAKLINREPLTWFQRFQINRGQRDGIKNGQAVLNNGYLIGHIFKVFSNYAIVSTIADPISKISCRIKGTKYYGILNGQGGGSILKSPTCQLNYLFRDIRLTQGMIVETSGFSLQIPPGIPIGSIFSVKGKLDAVVNNIFKKANVFPFVDFTDSTFVSIIIKN
jgi:rod shape-determining protein MreC